MSILCCQKAHYIIIYLQHNFWTWVPPPPPLNIKKTAQLAKYGFPNWHHSNHCIVAGILQSGHAWFWSERALPPWAERKVPSWMWIMSSNDNVQNLICQQWCFQGTVSTRATGERAEGTIFISSSKTNPFPPQSFIIFTFLSSSTIWSMSVFPVAIFSAKCAAKRPSVGSD